MFGSKNEQMNDLTWRTMQQPMKTRIYRWYLGIAMDRLRLPCARIERMQAMQEWAEAQKRRHFHGGMVVYPVPEREE
jgi:hypothetical protein